MAAKQIDGGQVRKAVARALLVGVSSVSAEPTVVVGIGGATADGKSHNGSVEIKTADGHTVTMRVPQSRFPEFRQATDAAWAGVKGSAPSEAKSSSSRLEQTQV